MSTVQDIEVGCPVCGKPVPLAEVEECGFTFDVCNGIIDIDTIHMDGIRRCPHCGFRVKIMVPLRFSGNPDDVGAEAVVGEIVEAVE